MQFFCGDALENLQVGISGAVGVGGGGNILAQVIEAGEHAAIVAIASGGDGFVERFAGTKRCAMLRVRELVVTQRANDLLSESFRGRHAACDELWQRADRVHQCGALLVFFEKLFCVHGGHAPGARRGNSLTVAVILHVSRDENAGNAGFAAIGGKQITVGVGFDFAREKLTVLGSCPMATKTP